MSARTDARLAQQRLDVPPASEREQQMLGVDCWLTEHPRLILSQQDQVVRLVSEHTDHRER
jgi:hypothetical protein